MDGMVREVKVGIMERGADTRMSWKEREKEVSQLLLADNAALVEKWTVR